MPTPVSEVVSERTAKSSTWRNDDGSTTVRSFAGSQFYQPAGKADWAPIDTSLGVAPGKGDRVQSGANSWQVSFGPTGAADAFQQIDVAGNTIGFTPEGGSQKGAVPSVLASTATYAELWPGVDLVDQVTSDAVVENLVLKAQGVPSSFAFSVSGATVKPNPAGGLDVVAGGKTVGVIPAPTVSTAKYDADPAGGVGALPGSPALSSKVSAAKLSVVGGRVVVSVSPEWLAMLPKAAFPVVIDPSFEPLNVYGTQAVAFSNASGSMSGQAALGQDSGGVSWVGATYIPFPSPPTAGPGEQPWVPASARLYLTCGYQVPCNLSNPIIYGLSSAPTSFGAVIGGQQLYSDASGYPFTALNVDIASWFSAHRTGSWFGFRADGPQKIFPASGTWVDFVYYQEPPAPAVLAPAAGSTVASSTPTFTASTTDPNICAYTDPPEPPSGVWCDFPQNVLYDFKVSTSPDWNGGRVVADSGWIPQPYTTGGTLTANGYQITTSNPIWSPPPGSLSDGVTYYLTVLSADSSQNPENFAPLVPGGNLMVPPAIALPATSFTVRQRLGGGGPAPTDTVGAAPGQSSTPSAGAPSPGTAPASVTVNEVTGNLALAVGTPSMKTLDGPAGVTLSYNSSQSSGATGTNYGLSASYFLDPGSHAFPSSTVSSQTDPNINVASSYSPPVGGLQPHTPYMARWTGSISLPAGTWQLGALSTGGIRIYLDGSSTPIYNGWAGGVQNLSFASTTVSGGHQIKVEAWDPAGTVYPSRPTTMQLWANNVTTPSQPVPYIVPSSWLTPQATGLPVGWTMGQNAAGWTSITDLGTQIVVHSASGDVAAFTKNTNGTYQPPAGDSDALSVINGQVQLSTASGLLYVFNTSGIADDRHPAALQYTYGPLTSGPDSPIVLQTITDPVSSRSITLSYGNASACTSQNSAKLLCGISYWDGTSSSFLYNSNQQLAQVVSPGGNISQFGYDADGHLNDIRDALANDYLIAGGSGVPTCTAVNQSCIVDTWITYDTSGRVATVTQPRPVSGAARPQRTYTYVPSTTTPGAGSTRVAIAGFSPAANSVNPAGVASSVSYDSKSRIVSQTDSVGRTARTAWDGADRPLISADPTGLQNSTVYDLRGNVTDTYGPAPVACFDPTTVPAGVTVTAPIVGYLPLANAPTAPGCGVTVPHTQTGYDEGLTGLAVTYWSNGQYAGAASGHGTGNGGVPNSTCTGIYGLSGTSATSLCGTWAAGTTPPGVGTDASGQWSAKMTGNITMPSAGDWIFCVSDTHPLSMFIDGATAVTNLMFDDYTGLPTGGNYTNWCGDVTLTAGTHQVEIDMQGSPSATTSYHVAYSAPPSYSTIIEIPVSTLGPAYGLKTSSTDPDGMVTTTSYTGTGPEYGLPTATTVGTGAGALTTLTGYESPGTGSYLRKTSSILPAGNSTTYSYYTGTGGPLAAVCGVSGSTPQSGQLQTQTDPTPGGSGYARVQQFIYDAAGRIAGRRVGPSNTITSVGWQCTSYDTRGRVSSQTWPAFGSATARTVSYTYAVGGNPLRSSVSDANGTITSVVDLLGRAAAYTDANGQTSTVSYNQAGQVTATTGPQGTINNTYDASSGQLSTVSLGGTLLATASYNSVTGRPTGATYANNTSATIIYDTYGNQKLLQFSNTGGVITKNQVTRSPAGRIITELTMANGSTFGNNNPAGPSSITYTYDPEGRLVTAYLPDHSYATYSYDYNFSGCPHPEQGKNTNRSSVTIFPAVGSSTNTDYCYNTADQLTSTITTAGTNTNYAYDGHGNQILDGNTTLTWDASDRIATTVNGGTTTTYTFDAVDRVISRTTGGVVTKYSYGGFSDTPVATLTSTNAVSQGLVALPGGVMVTAQPSGNMWSYPDLHGNNEATTDNNGNRQGGVTTYDPWGNITAGATPVSNANGPSDLGAFGTAGKLTDTTTNITIMGARPYNPTEARFLAIDPVQGGCANAYTYGFGDPLNNGDLTGRANCGSEFAIDGQYGTILGKISPGKEPGTTDIEIEVVAICNSLPAAAPGSACATDGLAYTDITLSRGGEKIKRSKGSIDHAWETINVPRPEGSMGGSGGSPYTLTISATFLVTVQNPLGIFRVNYQVSGSCTFVG